MGLRLPLFCLSSVLFPGMRLPLHVFEDRYRRLVSDTLAAPEPQRCFGIVAIREGYEVGARGVQSAHRIGCEAQITVCEGLPDGRFDVEVAGVRRFRVTALDTTGPYLVGDVGYLDERQGEQPAVAAAAAAAAFEAYRLELSRHRGGRIGELVTAELPHDPVQLSYFLASTTLLTLPERQALLEAPDAATRLRRVIHALRIEQSAMQAVPSLPATEVARTAWSPN